MAQIEKSEKISITLPPEMLASLRERIEAGEYGSTSEAIRDAVRVWQHKEEERQVRLDAIRDRLEKSANSGTPIPIEDVFSAIEAKHQKLTAMAAENAEI